MLPYLAAVGVMQGAGWGTSVQLLALIGYCLVMIVPALALVGARALAGPRIEAWMQKMGARPRSTPRKPRLGGGHRRLPADSARACPGRICTACSASHAVGERGRVQIGLKRVMVRELEAWNL
ncbi:GAP family protein [Glutamicibacter nicotianae]|uniref:GAP family protein n=1 Tax=Glutamicibacter nicotianae TaxID=37929 RepID=UPI003CD0A2CB